MSSEKTLQIALEIYRLKEPSGYALIMEFYSEKITLSELGKRHKVAVSTAYEILFRNVERLRKLTFELMKSDCIFDIKEKDYKKCKKTLDFLKNIMYNICNEYGNLKI